VWFAYSADRKGSHPQTHLKHITNAFAGYPPLYQSGEIVEAACMAHARRKFHDLHIAHASPITPEALRRIAELYVIEDGIRGKPPNVRRAIRQEQAKPLLDAMHEWLSILITAATHSHKSPPLALAGHRQRYAVAAAIT